MLGFLSKISGYTQPLHRPHFISEKRGKYVWKMYNSLKVLMINPEHLNWQNFT